MSAPYAQHVGRKNVPQSEKADAKQVPNSAGGFSFQVDDWTRLDRFLILGSEGGSYYASERKLTVANAECVRRCVAADGLRTVQRIVDISNEGRAPKNDPALLALAIAMTAGDHETKVFAQGVLPKVARIGTHLFHFAEYHKALGAGWGRGARRAFGRWYTSKTAQQLAFQAMKYQARDGWSHRDLLRQAHPKAEGPDMQSVFRWITKGWGDEALGDQPTDEVRARIWAFERAKLLTKPADKRDLVQLVDTYQLPHECVPTEAKQWPEVWEALLPSMGLTALVRNLGKMTEVGVIAPLSAASRFVIDKLGDVIALREARLHPLNILVALKTYAQGHGVKGSLKWDPVQPVVDALDGAFYTAFKAIEPTGKSHLLGIDISGSMGSPLAGMPLTCRDGAAVMALVTAAVEPQHALFGFCTTFHALKVSPRDRLDRVVSYMSQLPMAGTDCSLPMVHATKNKLPVDVFCVYTDSETWAGSIHPHVALEEYRQKMGRPAKLVVVGMVANEFTIANPDDAGMLDVVGFDTATPSVISDFARG